MSGAEAGDMQGRDEHLARECMVLPVSANMFLPNINLVNCVQNCIAKDPRPTMNATNAGAAAVPFVVRNASAAASFPCPEQTMYPHPRDALHRYVFVESALPYGI
jgi:hypothetical protein